jgi:trigger factor
MVDAEFEAIWQRLTEDREKNQLDPADAERSDDDLRAEYRAISERRVRLGLLLSEVGRINDVNIESDEVNRAVMERARVFPGQENLVVSFYRENPQALAELRAPLFEEKVVDLIISQATVTDKAVSVEELVRDPDAGASDAAPAKAKKPRKKAAAKGAAKKAAAKKTPAKKTASRKPTAKKPAAKKKSD